MTTATNFQGVQTTDYFNDSFCGLHQIEAFGLIDEIKWTLTAERELIISGTSKTLKGFECRIDLTARKDEDFAWIDTYGYRKGENGEPEVVPEEAEYVKKMFDLYLDGYSTRKIADYLNEQGAITRRGNEWNERGVQRALSNEKYIGDMLMQKTYSVDCISKKTKKNNGELPKYLISNNHTPIVSREVFKLVQAETAKRNSKRKKSNQGTTELGKYNSKYALSDVLICGECGSSYRRNVKYDNGRKKVYWRCINRIENGTKFCNKSSGVREEKLHAAICRALSKISPSKEDIYNAMKVSLEYGITEDDTSLNIYNIKLNIKQLQDEAEDYMMKAATTEGDKSKYLEEVEK